MKRTLSEMETFAPLNDNQVELFVIPEAYYEHKSDRCPNCNFGGKHEYVEAFDVFGLSADLMLCIECDNQHIVVHHPKLPVAGPVYARFTFPTPN